MSHHSVTTEEQFIIYHETLRNELDIAFTHYEIAKTLREFRRNRRSEFKDALTFFKETMDANLFSAVMAINRGFIDKRGDCLQLDKLFEFVKQNLGLFSTSAFQKRLEDKGMSPEEIQHWSNLHIEITAQTVFEDEVRVKSLSIDNLKAWRNKRLAHIDMELAEKKTSVMDKKPITVKEIDDILEIIDEILNRYSVAYDGVTHKIGLPPVKYQMEYLMDALAFYKQSRKKLG